MATSKKRVRVFTRHVRLEGGWNNHRWIPTTDWKEQKDDKDIMEWRNRCATEGVTLEIIEDFWDVQYLRWKGRNGMEGYICAKQAVAPKKIKENLQINLLEGLEGGRDNRQT